MSRQIVCKPCQRQALVSADRAFGDVPGLAWVNPATRDLDELIARYVKWRC